MDKTISEIADDEKVARILFTPSHIYKGRVSPKAFKLEKLKSGAEDYISVLRYNADQLDTVSAVFQPRTKGNPTNATHRQGNATPFPKLFWYICSMIAK